MNATQSDRNLVEEARSSFCEEFTGMDVFGLAPDDLARNAELLRLSAEELESVGDTEFATAARSLADGMEAAQELTELAANLHEGVSATTIDELGRRIDRLPEVAELEFVSKYEALEEFKRLYEDDPQFSEEIADLGPDSLPASFRVVVENPDDMTKIHNILKSAEEIEEVVISSGLGLSNLNRVTLEEVLYVCWIRTANHLVPKTARKFSTACA